MRKRLILLFVFFSVLSSAQSSLWEPYLEIDGVAIRKAVIECHNNELLTFEFENINNHEVTISWYEEVWVDGICKQDGASEEHLRELVMAPGEKIRGDCNFRESFYIGYKVRRGNKILQLTSFQLNNIIVKKVK